MPALSQPNDLITRREAILRVSALLGGAALVGHAALLSRMRFRRRAARAARAAFQRDDLALLDEIAETILPETSTPGAKAAGVGPFMASMVAEAYDAREQQIFRDGLEHVDRDLPARCMACLHGPRYRCKRVALLEQFDREQHELHGAARAARNVDAPAHHFRMMKELALLGYFTSEIGYTQAMRYVETPGRFDPCVPYAPGEKSWAPHA